MFFNRKLISNLLLATSLLTPVTAMSAKKRKG